jgi:hypothetical protein
MAESFCCHHRAYCPECAEDLARIRAQNVALRRVAGQALCYASAARGMLFYAPMAGCDCVTCRAV